MGVPMSKTNSKVILLFVLLGLAFGDMQATEIDPGKILVKTKANKAAQLEGLQKNLGHRRMRDKLFDQDGWEVVSLKAGETVEGAVAKYQASGLTEIAQPNYIYSINIASNDPLYASHQWSLNNTGTNNNDFYGNDPNRPGIGVAGADVEAQAGWDVLKKAGSMVVAVIDTGIKRNHEDFKDATQTRSNIWVNPNEIAGNGIDDDANGIIDDLYGVNTLGATNTAANQDDSVIPGTNIPFGHGTLVAGIIGAFGNNGKGISGVAWRVKIMACKAFDAEGNGSSLSIKRALNYARIKQASIVNLSFGGGPEDPAISTAISKMRDAKIIVVASAGNGGADGIGDNNDIAPVYPASYNYDNIVAVAATDYSDNLAGFSNYGATSVDIAAPGVAMVGPGRETSSAYIVADGTSFAAPMVTGALALLRFQHPTHSYQTLINRLLTTADPLPSLTGKVATGGRMNLNRALRAAPAGASDFDPND
jgi:serine protease